MNLLIISGSRNANGQTAKAANALLQGVIDAGGQGEVVFLPRMSIERCRQCEDSGWGICRTEGKCVIEDDFASLVERIKSADAVAFANPVYFSDLSESLRTFLDRLRRTCITEKGKPGVAGKPALGICVAGGSGGGAPECCAILQRVLNTCGFDTIEMLPARRQNLEMKANALRLTGKGLAQAQQLSK